MISKLKGNIDKEIFIENVNNRLMQNNNLIVDSFISHTCNLTCKHCYFGEILPSTEAINLKRWQNIIEEAIRLEIKHFHFSGKESFLDKNIFPILKFLSSKKDINNLFYGVVSNGTSLSSTEYNKILTSNLSYLEISLEGLGSYNDKIRGVGVFKKIHKLIGEVSSKGKINLTSTIFEDNHEVLINMIDFFRNKDISKFNFAPILYYSSSKFSPIKSLSPNSMLSFITKCLNYINTIDDRTSLNIRICLTKQIAYNLFCSESFLKAKIDEYIYKGNKIIYQAGNKLIEISFPLLSIPFLNEIIITHDGYVISCADDIHYKNITNISLPNINAKHDSFLDILGCRHEFINQYLKNNLN